MTDKAQIREEAIFREVAGVARNLSVFMDQILHDPSIIDESGQIKLVIFQQTARLNNLVYELQTGRKPDHTPVRELVKTPAEVRREVEERLDPLHPGQMRTKRKGYLEP